MTVLSQQSKDEEEEEDEDDEAVEGKVGKNESKYQIREGEFCNAGEREDTCLPSPLPVCTFKMSVPKE